MTDKKHILWEDAVLIDGVVPMNVKHKKIN
jgi:hypothetical protein